MPLEFEQHEEQETSLQKVQGALAERQATIEPTVAKDAQNGRVRRLVRWLAPKNPLKKLTTTSLSIGQPPNITSLVPIKKTFQSNLLPRWGAKEVGLWLLREGSLTKEQRQEAVSLLEKYLKTSLRKGISRNTGFVIGVSGALTLLITQVGIVRPDAGGWKSLFMSLFNKFYSGWINLSMSIFTSFTKWLGFDYPNFIGSHSYWALLLLIGLPLFGFLPISLMCVAWDARKVSRIHGLVLDTLGALGEVSGIPPLAEYASKGNFPLNQRAREALLSLLPLLTPEQLGTFPSRTVPDLCKSLPRGDTETQLALLRALDLIGDARAIPALTQLVQRSEESAVREKAQELILILEVRESELNLKQNLLRASQSPKESSEQLLRPVFGEVETAPQELLRPSEGEKPADRVS